MHRFRNMIQCLVLCCVLSCGSSNTNGVAPPPPPVEPEPDVTVAPEDLGVTVVEDEGVQVVECEPDGKYRVCYDGDEAEVGVGLCQQGEQTCLGGQWGVCVGQVLPVPEYCDKRDNDCNGVVDDGVANDKGECLPPVAANVVISPKADGTMDLSEENSENVVPTDDGGFTLEGNPVNEKFIWIANSGEGTLSKLDTNTGQETARYVICDNPSRTSVDLFGNCWVGCRGDGGVAKLWPRAEECVDKNGNGVIETAVDLNGDGQVKGNEILPFGDDECVAFITYPEGDTGFPGTRAVAVDHENYPWVAYWNSRKLYRLDPDTGAVIRTIPMGSIFNGHPYGISFDSMGRLWLSGRGSGSNNGLGMVDPSASPAQILYWSTPGKHNTYGVAVDVYDRVWLAGGEHRKVSRFDPTTQTWLTLDLGGYAYARGLAATVNDDGEARVYVGHHTWSGSCSSSHYVSVIDADSASHLGVIDTAAGVNKRGPVGVAVDSEGYVWAVNQCDSSASKIDPTDWSVVGTYPVGEGPYTYSDMTGSLFFNVIVPGYYRHRFRGYGQAGLSGLSSLNRFFWISLDVDYEAPEGTWFELRFRAADDEGSLNAMEWSEPYGPYPSASPNLDFPFDLTGILTEPTKFLDVEFALYPTADAQDASKPVIKDFKVQYEASVGQDEPIGGLTDAGSSPEPDVPDVASDPGMPATDPGQVAVDEGPVEEDEGPVIPPTPCDKDGDLSGHWPLDDGSGTTASDESGNGNPGNLPGGPAWIPGKFGQALELDGQMHRIIIPEESSLDVEDEFSFSIWLAPYSGAQNMGIVLKGYAPNNWYAMLKSENNALKAVFGSPNCGGADIVIQGSSSLPLGSWTHLVFTWKQATKQAEIYVNGVLDATGTVECTLQSNNSPLFVGEVNDQNFWGMVDDIRLYNRVLNIKEVCVLNKGVACDAPVCQQ